MGSVVWLGYGSRPTKMLSFPTLEVAQEAVNRVVTKEVLLVDLGRRITLFHDYENEGEITEWEATIDGWVKLDPL